MTKLTPAARKARLSLITARSAFGVGVAVSLAANVYASDHTPIGVAVGLWTPLAFLISMALIENVQAKGTAGKIRLVAIAFLALIAGWTSYWHLVEVALAGGADALTAHMLPLTVDVMMALAGPAMKARRTAQKPRTRAKNVTPITRAKRATKTA
jgi:hypothetical protein